MVKAFVIRHKWPLVVAALTILVRLIYLCELSLHPGFSVPVIDEKWHWEWAHEILSKSFWGEGAYFRAPLYPYLLAFLAKVTSSSIFWTKFLQILISGGSAAFVYLISARLFNRHAGLVAGIAYAFYGTLVFYETMFLIPVVFMFFLTWGMYRVVAYRETATARTWLATGLIFGLGAVSRPNVLLVIPFLMLWLYLTRKGEVSLVRRARLPVVMMIGVMVAVFPVTVRNLIVTGDFILISSQGGVNLHLGNNEYADGLTMIMPEVDLDESVSWREFGLVTKAAAQRRTGREMSEAELSSFWTGKAVDFIVSNPGTFLKLIWRKTVYLVSGIENSDNTDIYYQRVKSGLYSVLLWDKGIKFPFGVLLPVAILGAYLLRNSIRQLLPLYIFLLAYIPSIVLFLVTARHRLALIPFLIIIAAGGLVKLIREWRKTSVRDLGIGLAIFVVPLVVFNFTYYEEGHGSDFQSHFNDGLQWEHLGDMVGAEKEYLLADEAFPFSASLINNLAHVQYQLGKHAEADKNYHRALDLEPDFAQPYNNLGLLVQEQGELDSALALYRLALARFDTAMTMPDKIGQVYLNVADVFEEMGELDSAAAAYDGAQRSAPDFGKGYLRAAAFYARHGGHIRADSLFGLGMHKQDLSGVDFFNWGLSLMQRKRLSESVGMMLRGLKRDPTIYQAYYCIAYAYHEGGQPKDSVLYYLDKCLTLDSTCQPAIDLKRELGR